MMLPLLRQKMKWWWVDDTFQTEILPLVLVDVWSSVCRDTGQTDRMTFISRSLLARLAGQSGQGQSMSPTSSVASLCPQASVRPGADRSHPRGHFWGGPVERVLVSLKDASGAYRGQKWGEKEVKKEQRMKVVREETVRKPSPGRCEKLQWVRRLRREERGQKWRGW